MKDPNDELSFDPEAAISVRGVRKRYRLGVIDRKSFRDELVYRWLRFRGEDPKEKMGKIGDPRLKADGWFHALDGVSFDIRPGEAVGLIGRNGAGKSTMLKILARITEPDEGGAVIRGRVGSLLEVGTGFHPELTGRENVYLNGAILGMKKTEIDAKFDEIVDFAEIGPFLDTPVKRYSSGMHVKLAFAVAANLDTDILLVDEVLSVGDLPFRQKSLAKMKSLVESGKTIVFVSHMLAQLQQVCSRCIWFQDGNIRKEGDSATIIAEYSSDVSQRREPKTPEENEHMNATQESEGARERNPTAGGAFESFRKSFADRLSKSHSAISEIQTFLNDLKPVRALFSTPHVDKERIGSEMELVASVPGTVPRNPSGSDPEVVVTVTSTPERMYDVHYSLHSLLSQERKPNRVVLWLGEEKFPHRMDDVPDRVRRLMARGLEIRFCHDVGPYTRVVPALDAFPEAVLVSAADDMFYPADWLDVLLREHFGHPMDVIGFRANGILRTDSGAMAPHAEWTPVPPDAERSGADVLLTTMSGVLYPPHAFSSDVSDESLFSSLAPHWPDIWLWAMSRRVNRVFRKLPLHAIGGLLYVNPEREAGLRSESTLRIQNRRSNGYEKQLAKLLSTFPDL